MTEIPKLIYSGRFRGRSVVRLNTKLFPFHGDTYGKSDKMLIRHNMTEIPKLTYNGKTVVQTK